MERNIPKNVNFSVLTPEQIQKIHRASVTVLSEFGVKMDSARMREELQAAGAQICEGDIVKVPEQLINKCLETVPKGVSLYSRDGEEIIKIGAENNIYFGAIIDVVNVLDHHTNKVRKMYREDVKNFAVLEDYLDSISYTTPAGMFNGVDPRIASQIAFLDTCRYFTKAQSIVTAECAGFEDCMHAAQDFVGGKDKLAEKPFIMYYAEPISPFMHVDESVKRIIVCAENGIPITYMPYSMMGGTAPVTPVGALIQNNADVLMGLVMSQVIKPGASFIYGSMPTVFDMKTTVGSYAAPEFHMCVAASADLADYYGVPFYGSHCLSDAKTIDAQSVAEFEMTMMSTMLSKANLVHDGPFLDHANNITLIGLLLFDEMFYQTKAYVNGVDTSDEMIDLMLQTIKNVGPGGHYLEERSTLKNFKKIWYPKRFKRLMQNPDESDLMDRLIAEVDHILETHVPKPPTPEQEEVLASYEAEFLSRYK